jgi:hypothetical protein
MNKKTSTKFLFIVILIIIAIIIGYFVLSQNKSQVMYTKNENINSIKPTQIEKSIIYKNDQYGFSFTLPTSWRGYSIIKENWEGNMIDGKVAQIFGPKISIRHPLWKTDAPRQDIPIMIFTPAQWDLIQKEKLSLGAAPIGPSELGRNSHYIFALPARYNFAYIAGFEEVQKIIDDKSFLAL